MGESTTDLLAARTILINPFDMLLYETEDGVATLHSKITGLLRGLNSPFRFVYWQMPATLAEKVNEVVSVAAQTTDPLRREMQDEYRRYYMDLNNQGNFLRSMAGMAFWTTDKARTLASVVSGVLETYAEEGSFPKLFDGKYQLRPAPFWHLAPYGAADGRMYFSILNSYEFNTSVWNFFRPLKDILKKNYPMAVCIDVPTVYERNTAVNKIEGVLGAYTLHLRQLGGDEDSQAVRRVLKIAIELWKKSMRGTRCIR